MKKEMKQRGWLEHSLRCLIICMCALSLFGCVSKNQTSKETETSILDETPQMSETTAESEDSQNPETVLPDVDAVTEELLRERYPGKTILIWAYNNVVNVTPRVNLAVNDELVKQGYDFILWFQRFSEKTYAEKLNAAIAEENAPDLLSAGVGSNGTLQGTYRAVMNGWLLCLDDYLEQQGQALWNSMPEKYWETCKVNGHYYGVASCLPGTTDYRYYVNEALLDKYGITKEELAVCSVAELGGILQRVSAEKDCALLNLTSLGKGAGTVNGYSPVVEPLSVQTDVLVVYNQSQEGGIVNLFEQPEAVAWFRAVADYRSKGYLSTEAVSFGSVEDAEEAAKEADIQNFFIYAKFGNGLKNIQDEVAMLQARYPKAGNIIAIDYMPYPLITQYNSISGVCSASKNQDMALEALTITMTNQTISDLLLYGLEGVDYTLSGGKVVGDWFMWAYSMYFGNTFISTPTVDQPDNIYEIYQKEIEEMPLSPTVGIYLDFSEYQKEISEMQTIFQQYIGLLDGTYQDVDAVIGEINEKLYAAGLEQVLIGVNEKLAEAQGKNE